MPPPSLYIDKAIFLSLYKEARDKAFDIESTISNSFAGAGLIPFNPQHVLDKLTIRLHTPTLPGSSGSDSNTSQYTPHTSKYAKGLKRQVSATNSLLQQQLIDSSVPVVSGIQQITKEYEQVLHRLALSEQECSHLRVENRHVKKRRANKGLQLAQNGIQANNTVSAETTEVDKSANQRPRQRCSFCRKPGHKCNRCPDIVVNSNS